MPILHNLFYAPPGKIINETIEIAGPEFHHIINVLRKRRGDILQFTDGKGSLYKTAVTGIKRISMIADIIEKSCFERKGNMAIDLAFVPLKGNRNDFIIEKGTELGVHKFILFTSRNSVVNDVSHARVERFEKIAVSAMLQSQQYWLPEIITTNNIFGLFKDYDTIITADMQGSQEVLPNGYAFLFVTGPEGGFTDDEIRRFTDNGARLLSLGKNRLRSETAAITGTVKILAACRQI